MKNNMYVANVLAQLLDNKFSLLGYRFGISAIIDLVPGIGDILNAGISCYILFLAIQMRIPKLQIARMIGNIAFCFLIGGIPILGDAVYFFYKPNLRNIHIIQSTL